MLEILYGMDAEKGQLDIGHAARDGVPICGSKDHEKTEMFSFFPDGVKDLSTYVSCRRCWLKIRSEINEYKKADKKSSTDDKKEGN